MAQYREYQLERSKYQRICVVPGKKNRMLISFGLEKKNQWLGHILWGESLLKEEIDKKRSDLMTNGKGCVSCY